MDKHITINHIKSYRQIKKLSQSDLAKNCNISLRTLISYENLETYPNIHTANIISKELNTDTKTLFPLIKKQKD